LIGIGGVGEGEGNFSMANGGWQRNSYSHVNSLNYNTDNGLLGMQAIPPSSQVANEHYNNTQNDYTGSQFGYRMNQDEIQKMQRIGKILESQAYAVPDTQTKLTSSGMNNGPMYPPAGSYLESRLLEEWYEHTRRFQQ